MTAKHLAVAAFATFGFVLVGCGDPGTPEGPPKEKLIKTGPPPQWRGPGQPGGPGGAPGGAPAPPPPGSIKGPGG